VDQRTPSSSVGNVVLRGIREVTSCAVMTAHSARYVPRVCGGAAL
jgi:hypothetical protein